MTTRGVRIAAAIAATALALTACGGKTQPAPTTSSPTTATTTKAAWPPIGMTGYGTELAWQWVGKNEPFDCEDYQEGCFGITVIALNGCPNGVYVEIGVVSGGAVVDKANEITPALGPRRTARVALSPPGGVKTGEQAQLSRMSCL